MTKEEFIESQKKLGQIGTFSTTPPLKGKVHYEPKQKKTRHYGPLKKGSVRSFGRVR